MKEREIKDINGKKEKKELCRISFTLKFMNDYKKYLKAGES